MIKEFKCKNNINNLQANFLRFNLTMEKIILQPSYNDIEKPIITPEILHDYFLKYKTLPINDYVRKFITTDFLIDFVKLEKDNVNDAVMFTIQMLYMSKYIETYKYSWKLFDINSLGDDGERLLELATDKEYIMNKLKYEPCTYVTFPCIEFKSIEESLSREILIQNYDKIMRTVCNVKNKIMNDSLIELINLEYLDIYK